MITITPGKCFCDIKHTRAYFNDARVVRTNANSKPGELLLIDEGSCLVAAGEYSIRLGQIKMEENQTLSMPELCQSLGLEKGDSIV